MTIHPRIAFSNLSFHSHYVLRPPLQKIVRPFREAHPMSATERYVRILRRSVGLDDHEKQTRSEKETNHQYRIPPREETKNGVLFFFALSENTMENVTIWLHQSSFTNVILSYLVIYLVIILVFSAIAHWVIATTYNRSAQKCCSGYDFDDQGYWHNFGTSFELSWTTFSTVGYGVVSPPANQNCHFIRFLLAIEAFIGVVYAGMCGA